MKTIKLKRTTINIPETWDEVPRDKIRFVFLQLMRLHAGDITPFQFKFELLVNFTGYKPKKRRKIALLFFSLKLTRLRIFKPEKFKQITDGEIELRDQINFNLIQLAEKYNFAFDLEGKKIVPNYEFKYNPIDWFEDAPVFTRDITIETNITAKQYIDCVDLMQGASADDNEVRQHCMLKIMSVLYGQPLDAVRRHSPEIPFAVMCWFRGIVEFFRHHPNYSVLYDRVKDQGAEPDDDDKINLGMSETALYLEKEGYSFVRDMNVIDFFDAQVKALKDSINKALDAGLSAGELSQKTGITLTTINKLKHE